MEEIISSSILKTKLPFRVLFANMEVNRHLNRQRKGKLPSPSLSPMSVHYQDAHLMCGSPSASQPYSIKGQFRDEKEFIRAVCGNPWLEEGLWSVGINHSMV